MRVLIIGAGLGGLCLAHALRSDGHDVTVHERSTLTGQQPASYGIHLNADGLRALHTCLPAKSWAMVDDAALPARDLIRFHDPLAGVISTWNRETPANATDPVTRRRAISRGALRAALLHGLDDAAPLVHWGQRFVRYEEIGDQRVRAHFEDGSTAEGDLLVGADGSNSVVRAQRLPAYQRVDLGIVNIAGRTPVTPQLVEALPAELLDSAINNVAPAGAGWMFISTWNTKDPTLGGHESVDRFVVWAWVGPRASYPNDVEDRSGADLKALVEDRIADWPAHFHHLVEATSDDAVAPVVLRSMPELAPWTPSTVTLLGDAIHNMTPTAGVGANTALRDAQTLSEAIAASPADPRAAVAAYEAAMRDYANRALALSSRNAGNAATGSRGSRRVFRTLLRLTEMLPVLQHRIFRTPKGDQLAVSRPA